uniref:Cysteine-rich protein 1 n=1 Tax=Oryzias melastigma TaxID=30732 RepID=A0A3B3D7T1_ORYME
MVGYCPTCGKPVYFGEKKRSLGRDYHPLCLKCFRCKRQLTAGQHAEYDEKPYCSNCYMKLFGPRGLMSMCFMFGHPSMRPSTCCSALLVQLYTTH